jgi:hypothetical protein
MASTSRLAGTISAEGATEPPAPLKQQQSAASNNQPPPPERNRDAELLLHQGGVDAPMFRNQPSLRHPAPS